MSRENMQRFGARVRAGRERLGVSEDDLADRVEKYLSCLGGVEPGEGEMGLVIQSRIALALGVTQGALVEEAEGPRSRCQNRRDTRGGR
jgi:ribosome-binding protein aMBF1 (putative translation factor)